MIIDQYFTVTYEPDLRNNPPKGFTWDLNSAGLYDIRPGLWRDCTASGNPQVC